jgi:ribosomal-protein-alanine N-acetyltransferase
MKRAVYAACLYGFDKQGLNRIDAACLPANEPSKRLLERVGFRHEGYARAYLNINGDWRDHLLFGLLSKDLTPPI